MGIKKANNKKAAETVYENTTALGNSTPRKLINLESVALTAAKG
jgi:hypothetical protein